MALFGPADRNLRTLRDLLSVRLVSRDNRLSVSGAEANVKRAARVLERLQQMIRKSDSIGHEQVLTAIAETSEPARRNGAPTPSTQPTRLGVTANDKPIEPKTEGQKAYVNDIANNDLTFCLGPAGTGKTYLATAMAVSMLRNQQIRRIILVRPAVEAGEKLGYLPGDLAAKINPFLRPLLDALQDMLDIDQLKRLLANEVIQILPLAYMRGRTLNDACVIMDEAQNTTRGQMLMFLTRLGHGSKMIVTGDNTQIDLDDPAGSGLLDGVRRLRNVPGVAISVLTGKDIVRHPLVQRVVDAYAQDGISPVG